MDFYNKLEGMTRMGMPPMGGMPELDPKALIANMSDEQLQKLIDTNPELQQKLRQINTGGYKAYSSKEYYKLEKLEEHLDSEGGISIIPDKAFVLKFFTKTAQKLFVNVVAHPAIDPPDERALVDFDGETAWQHFVRTVITVALLLEGQPCKTVDVVLNPDVIGAVDKDPELASFLAQLITSHLNQKHKVFLQDKWNRLKEMRYKGGTVLHHRVKGRKLPNIQPVKKEIKEAEEQRLQELKESRKVKPEFTLSLEREGKFEVYDGDGVDDSVAFKLQFELPLLIHGRGIQLRIDKNALSLYVGVFYATALRLPWKPQLQSIKCVFVKGTRQLRITGRRELLKEQEDEKRQITPREGLESQLLYEIM